MTECEYDDFCKAFFWWRECGVGGDPKVFCDKHPRMKALLNSPKFKKQYANKEELVEKIMSSLYANIRVTSDPFIVTKRCISIIQNHGLEE